MIFFFFFFWCTGYKDGFTFVRPASCNEWSSECGGPGRLHVHRSNICWGTFVVTSDYCMKTIRANFSARTKNKIG